MLDFFLRFKKTKVSIIMPFYNVKEDYFKTCLDSIMNQTLKDFELIIINDCSHSNEECILKKYLHDKRIRYFKNEKNLGWAKNKNYYAKFARGKYIASIDSDDYVDPHFLEKLYNQAENLKADLCYCFVNLLDNRTGNITQWRDCSQYATKFKDKAFSFVDIKDTFFENCTASWNRIYRKDFYDKHIFYDEEIGQFEDYVPYFSGIINAKKIAFVNEELYFYRQNVENSNSYKIKKMKNLISYHKKVHKFFQDKNLFEIYRINFIEMVLKDYMWFEKTQEFIDTIKLLLDDLTFNIEDYRKLKEQYKKEEVAKLL